MEPKKFAALLRGIGSPAMEESLIKYQDHLLKIPGEDFAYIENLKNTNHLKGAKDADSLFNALLLPYKGKVVYIDFWGTWCGPCRDEMKYVGAAKDALKDKEVIFMYFANNSPEVTWKSMIKDMKLTGSNVVHYKLPDLQQNLLEQRLSIKGFPTYMLVDKDGKLVSTAAPRPSNPVELVKAVTVLLDN
ncbi:MAG: TlpA family protein disulfide reductase [Pedobacter sp.]|nr:MAG: TlpA family protein disulfide reductase [Pedobacter sp.]